MNLNYDTLAQIPGLDCEELRIIDTLPEVDRWEFLWLFRDAHPKYAKLIRVFEKLMHQQFQRDWKMRKYTEFLAARGINDISEWQVSESHTYLSK